MRMSATTFGMVHDKLQYRDHYVVLDDRYGMWTPEIWRKSRYNDAIVRLYSVEEYFPTRNEAYFRGKAWIDENLRD